MLLVFCKWAVVGMAVEAFGFLNLFGYVHFSSYAVSMAYGRTDLTEITSLSHTCTFGVHSDFFPVILSFLRQLPVIGNVLSLPGVGDVSAQQSQDRSLTQRKPD